jgi:glycerol-3-phosphate acyltransferase PlsX
MDYNNKGGAVLLGTKKIIMKGHGSSKAKSVSVCLHQVVDMHKANVCGIIADEVSKINVEIEE